MRHWLFKTEPDVFSIDDLYNAPSHIAPWEGVRNYQARNFLRDSIQKGDLVLFYHSRATPLSVVGIAEVVKPGYPDHFAFDTSHKYFDPKSKPESPTWYMVDIKFKKKFPKPVTTEEMKKHKQLKNMVLLQKGSRLSIQPVSPAEFQFILELADVKL
ncbi:MULTISPECIES: EVE domain-containing protein [Leptospira]|uniref:EVE domain-containing protein n=6 Tax=Leptospira santarosai TaxID=28183 RepID=A0AB73MNP6_9LEPT|nr:MULTISPECIES: EVE domain-containing protein [Leptospira]EMO59540.1 EVE domain protein [Leptospira santarosai str. CBC1416]ASV12026.1 EVE domain-containing protein [Leptospira santarosai]AVV51684.1 EVE domain protein [Leptospira santarosai]AVV78683.1 EVE domain protein [Leptospira santarosai]EKO32868.1 EVE domain protein [Leptospira santarosai str. MOR084]